MSRLWFEMAYLCGLQACFIQFSLHCFNFQKTVLKTHKDEECRTTYEKKCSTVPRTEVDLTIELHCTCEVCTRVVVKRFCNGYNSCKEVTELRCNRGQARKTRSGCKNEVCEENKIHKTRTVEEERCIENPRETCYNVEKEKAEVVPVKDCNHVPTTQCKPVKKIRQKEIVYPGTVIILPSCSYWLDFQNYYTQIATRCPIRDARLSTYMRK